MRRDNQMVTMSRHLLTAIFLLFALFILSSGCIEPPIQEPVVSVSDMTLANVSLQAITVNTNVTIFNPNPIGAKLNKVAFDVDYLDDSWNYLGHGEQTNIEVKNNGNTTVTIPVTVGTVQAVSAVGSLIRKGSITLRVNGSAFIDVKVTSFEKRFEQSREFQASDIEGLIPAAVIPGTSISVSDKLQQLGGLLGSVT
jgi:LEA14-like dessication related protein